MLKSSGTLQASKERWFGTPRGAKGWRGKLGASPLWVSALVSLCCAECVLLVIHRAGSLWITNQQLLWGGGVWWLWEALLRVVFAADVVVHWQRSPAHSICGILAVQTSASPASCALPAELWSHPFDFL